MAAAVPVGGQLGDNLHAATLAVQTASVYMTSPRFTLRVLVDNWLNPDPIKESGVTHVRQVGFGGKLNVFGAYGGGGGEIGLSVFFLALPRLTRVHYNT